ncbi:DDE-type integrase/transposase/recombinase [Rhizobium leguminosarum]|uniref:DDE-type integrase/transposase/recombinase n=1 Tax=Rhizobium leguminosarum TaxID=384 RepID=UPI0004854BBB|nr:DDE-type integrase/transposase/recombinase [Rhizobium leguminosarum]
MILNLDISQGDRFLIESPDINGVFVVEGDATAEPLTFIDDKGNREHIGRLDFAVLQAKARAIRTFRKGQIVRALTSEELKGFYSPPKGNKISERERKNWQIRVDDVHRAGRLLFYTVAWFETPCSRGDDGLETFIVQTLPDAEEAGYPGIPSASSIRKAIAKCVGQIPTLTMFLRRKNGNRKKTKFPKFVYDLGDEMVRWYYEEAKRKYIHAHKWFDERYYPAREQWLQSDEAKEGNWDGEPPNTQTLTNWITEARNATTLKIKYKTQSADRRVRGRGRSLEPLAPLETIILDQTLAPIWVIQEVEADGEIKFVVKRPWIVWAIDLYSRMIVGFSLTFDPPCIATLMACLRHVITPKTEWIARFGYCKGATDAFGSVSRVILDNAKAHIGRTMQTVGDVAGFRVIYAPIYTPEYKTWVERLNATMNIPLRSLPGGISADEDEENLLDARSSAAISIEALGKLMAHHIMEYHLRVHDGIGMAPARKWNLGLEEFGRTTVDDARAYRLILRRHEVAVLSAEGIYFRGHRFHHPGITSKLMSDMASYYASRRKSATSQTYRIKVHVFYDEMDTGNISVINQRTKEIVELPNFDLMHVEKPVSFAFADGERAYQRRMNKEFHTREEMAKARAEYTKELEAIVGTSSHGVSKNAIRILQGKELPELGRGNRIIDVKAERTVDGRGKAREIPISVALVDRLDDVSAGIGRKLRKKSKPAAARGQEGLVPDTTAPVYDEVIQFDGFDDESESALDDLARDYGFELIS